MQELEKILEEIEMKKKKCLDIVRVEIDPMEITIHREQSKGLRMAEDIIRKHMNDGWIPVEEQLPEERNLYLATAESAGFYFRLIGHWNAPGWTEETGQQKIIAWRPLPEPYCPERSDNYDGE